MTQSLPRFEQPRPHFHRDRWHSLNGAWDFAIDPEGEIRDRRAGTGLDRTITVPFAPESSLSGIGETGFMESVWYARDIIRPEGWDDARILLHFGAVDWQARVFADGRQIGLNRGGSTGFTIDLTEALASGRCRLVVHAEDHLRSGTQPAGKQSRRDHSWGCYYTRTTGIWQSVCLEAAGDCYLAAVDIVADADGLITLTPRPARFRAGLTFHAAAALDGRQVAEGTRRFLPGASIQLTIPDPHPWAPGLPTLYDLTYEIREGDRVVDRVRAYCGLRDVAIDGDRILLNGQEIYHRFVLDQGFYPDGIWTAPDDDALRRDIELAMSLGFNGARLHQKVFEPRFHYWADRLGYLTWGESASWGAEPEDDEANGNLLEEWPRIVAQCRNHPSIIAWSPHNESGWGKGRNEPIEEPHLRLIERLAAITRALDPTRPVNDASGWVHRDTDIWTVHSYQQDPLKLSAQMAPYPDVYRDAPQSEPAYAGQPYILDEFGGAAFDAAAAQEFTGLGSQRDAGAAWGYGKAPASADELEARIRGQVAAVNAIPHMRGWCYTQLTDVEQEQNGILTCHRDPKLPVGTCREIFSAEPPRLRQKKVAAE
jgi:beta-galactosidase/beta-glucuronidase